MTASIMNPQNKSGEQPVKKTSVPQSFQNTDVVVKNDGQGGALSFAPENFAA